MVPLFGDLQLARTIFSACSTSIFSQSLLQEAAITHDYLGEYTGELVTQQEADKRGKIYDLVNLSFLFDLNETVRTCAVKYDYNLKRQLTTSRLKAGHIIYGDHELRVWDWITTVDCRNLNKEAVNLAFQVVTDISNHARSMSSMLIGWGASLSSSIIHPNPTATQR